MGLRGGIPSPDAEGWKILETCQLVAELSEAMQARFMSRTYDALKRVEKERSPYKVIGIDDMDSPTATPVTAGIPEAQVAETHSPEGMPCTSEGADPVVQETLFARCTPTTWAPDTRSMLFFGAEEPIGGAEEFRRLRTQFHHLREKQPLRRILVTSSVAREGRSFVAANLAQVMARQPGCRSLLIDADLRNPSLHSFLGTPASPGLSEYLLDEIEEFEVMQRGQMANLFFIASGRGISGQAEVISNGRLRTLLDRLETMFDWIIIDSPPAITVSDSSLIANLCDGVLLVARSNSTPFDIVRKARQRLPYERILGVVLNEIPT